MREVAAMEPHTILWDLDPRGFCARRQFSDVITYSVFFRTRDGQQRFYKIGRHGVFTPTQAREVAREVLRNVAVGKDPGAELQALRHGPTVADLCDSYMADMDAGHINGKKASTVKSDKSRIATHIKPKIGSVKIAAITSDHVEKFMQSLSPGSAKRVTGLLGAIFSFAVKKGMRETNPCAGVEKPSDMKRTRRVSDLEYAQLGSALDGGCATLNRTVADVLMLLAISGWRSSEARCLRWSEVDLERQIATLGDTKSGLSVRPLSSAAVEIIKRQNSEDRSEYVFAYERGKPVNNLRPHWLKLGIAKDVTPHTIRHSFASLSADMGYSDNVIAGMLGHARNSITSRYIHLEKALIESADAVAKETLRLMRL
jgi:integrase